MLTVRNKCKNCTFSLSLGKRKMHLSIPFKVHISIRCYKKNSDRVDLKEALMKCEPLKHVFFHRMPLRPQILHPHMSSHEESESRVHVNLLCPGVLNM